MIVIACKFQAEDPVIFDCVRSCRKYLPNEKILVVDGNSSDKSYFDKLREIEPDANILYFNDSGNTHYDTGAYWIGYEMFPEEEFFYLIHDSCEFLDTPPESLKTNEITIFVTNYGYTGSHPENAYGGAPIDRFPLYEPIIPRHLMMQCEYEKQLHELYQTNGYSFVFGPIMFVSRNLLTKLYNKRFHHIQVNNKQDSTDMERCWGIAYALEGYPQIPFMISWAEVMRDVGPFDKGKVLQNSWFKKQWIKRI